MISDAVKIGQNQQQLGQKKLTDVVDTIYKSALIQNMQSSAETSRLNAQTALAKSLRQAPLEVPGKGKISLDEWNALDTKTKAYSYYAFDAGQRGEEVIPYDEWSRQTNSPTAFDLYNLAKDDPEFQNWLTEYRQSGATRISLGEKVETKRALTEVENINYFTDPKGGLQDDLNKYLSSPEVRDELLQFYDDPTGREIAKVRAKENFAVSKIKSSGGKIVDQKLDGRDFVWTVEWPNGDTTEVRVGN